jgi:integrase
MANIFKPKGAKKYVLFYQDADGKRKKKTLATDKTVSQRIAREIENRVALRREGLIDAKDESYKAHASRPLAEHLSAWKESLESRGATPKYIGSTLTRIRRLVALIRGAKLADIDPPKATKRSELPRYEAALARWADQGRLSELDADRVQKALATLRNDGRSAQTCNHYLASVMAFGNWCYDTHRLKEDPIRGVKRFNVKEDRRHDRRTLSLDELHRVIRAAQQGPVVMGLPGPTRALCYRLAASTGLRYSEIASIKPASFDWRAPSVTVEAAYTKNGEPATLRLREDLADDLRPFVATLPADTPVFPLPDNKGAEILRSDLAAAGIEYQDASGLFFDFHALRCQMATLADQAGVSPRVVQRLMRHSSLELTDRYTRPRVAEIEAAASRLPSLKPEREHPETAVMTGTDAVLRSTATGNATEGSGADRNALIRMHVTENQERLC